MFVTDLADIGDAITAIAPSSDGETFEYSACGTVTSGDITCPDGFEA